MHDHNAKAFTTCFAIKNNIVGPTVERHHHGERSVEALGLSLPSSILTATAKLIVHYALFWPGIPLGGGDIFKCNCLFGSATQIRVFLAEANCVFAHAISYFKERLKPFRYKGSRYYAKMEKQISFDDENLAATRESVEAAKVVKGTPPNMSFRSKVLRSNLTRTHKNRDPLFYYEVQKVLGVGSMGSVVKVRKRDEVIGGSARKELQGTFRREKLLQDCGRIPFCGWIAQHCLWNPLGNHEQSIRPGSVTSSIRSLLGSKEGPFRSLTDSAHSTDSFGTPTPQPKKKYDMTYAMKSIHLSRVTDPAFVEELRNEVAVLKALDHPHIVRCIETFEHRNQIFIIMEVSSTG
jgi:Protein kinase domain